MSTRPLPTHADPEFYPEGSTRLLDPPRLRRDRCEPSEGENRCESDNIFMAKVGDLACPSCGEPVEEFETVAGVEVDGEFIPEAELAEATT